MLGGLTGKNRTVGARPTRSGFGPGRKPEDFEVNFFCIGTMKSATTWLSHCLGAHPQVATSRRKEPNFFVHKWETYYTWYSNNFMSDWEWYRARWAHAEEGQILGDFSIKIIANGHVAPLLIQEYFPRAKFLVCLRDPVERLYSHFWHDRGRNTYAAPGSFEEALKFDKFVRHSRYAEQLSLWLERFPKDRFHFVLDIDYEQDSLSVVRDVYNFLEVSTDFVPSEYDQRVNPPARKTNIAKSLKSGGRTGLRSRSITGVLRGVRKAGLTSLVYSVTKGLDQAFTRRMAYPPLRSDVAEKARESVLPDIERLEGLLGRDLSPWKKGKR